MYGKARLTNVSTRSAKMDGSNSIDCFDLSRYVFVYGEFILFYFYLIFCSLHIDKSNLFIAREENNTEYKISSKTIYNGKIFWENSSGFYLLVLSRFFLSLFLVLCTFHTMSRIFLNKPKSVQCVIQIVSMESLRRKKLWHEQIPNTATYVFLSINLEQCVQLTYWFGIFRDALSRCMRCEQKDEKQSVRNPHQNHCMRTCIRIHINYTHTRWLKCHHHVHFHIWALQYIRTLTSRWKKIWNETLIYVHEQFFLLSPRRWQ